MSRPLEISCFDVNHLTHPMTRRASKLDHVSITSIGKLDGTKRTHAAFLVDVCSFENPASGFCFSRINYYGKDKTERYIKASIGHSIRALEPLKRRTGQSTECFVAETKDVLVGIIQRFWKCFGGSWIFATECHDTDIFVETCFDVENNIIKASEARDILVGISKIAAVSFDDEILDVVTRFYKAAEMRELLARLALNHSIPIRMVAQS